MFEGRTWVSCGRVLYGYAQMDVHTRVGIKDWLQGLP